MISLLSVVCAVTEPGGCAFAQVVAPFVQTPIFAVRSIFDGWQLDEIAGPPNFAGNKVESIWSALLQRSIQDLPGCCEHLRILAQCVAQRQAA